MHLSNAGPVLILSFILITFIFSAYEKIHGWQQTKINFKKLYKRTFLAKAVIPMICIILFTEVIISTYAALGIWDIIKVGDYQFATYACILASLLCLLLLIGLRILNDYSGAAKVSVYFLVSMLGLYWIQSF